MTGAGGQLGRALVETLGRAGDEVVALSHADWDVTEPPPEGLGDLDLVVHAAAWTDVDGAEAEPQEAAATNVGAVRWSSTTATSSRSDASRSIVRTKFVPVVP